MKIKAWFKHSFTLKDKLRIIFSRECTFVFHNISIEEERKKDED